MMKTGDQHRHLGEDEPRTTGEMSETISVMLSEIDVEQDDFGCEDLVLRPARR